MGQLSIDSNGTLYGTTFGGGRRCGTSGGGCGVIFRLRKSGSKYEYGLIYRLRERQDGAVPSPGLALGKDGSLYGAAVFGGPQGCGTVFALKPNARRYTFTVLHAFACSGPARPPAPRAGFRWCHLRNHGERRQLRLRFRERAARSTPLRHRAAVMRSAWSMLSVRIRMAPGRRPASLLTARGRCTARLGRRRAQLRDGLQRAPVRRQPGGALTWS